MIALLLSLLLGAAPVPDRRPPIDPCAADASFVAFRDDLVRAIARRDDGHVLSVVADDIVVNFGGGAGPADFSEAWRLERPETSPLWDELGIVLGLGCAREEDGSLWAPSLYRQLDDQEDPFSAGIAVRPGTRLHAAPDSGSPALATLDWDVVTIQSDDGADDWLAVALSDGRRGYVEAAAVRRPVDYRAGFAKVDGRWRMIVFVAGD